MGALYKLDFPNGKSYVGITAGTADRRFAGHCKKARSNSRDKGTLHRAITKYGEDAVTVSTLCIADDWKYLCLLEQRAIAALGTRSPAGYNLTDGGDGIQGLRHSEEAKAAMSASRKGRKLSPAVVEMLRERCKGNTYGLGTKRTPESREKISAALAGLKKSPQHRAALSKARTGLKYGEEGKLSRRIGMLRATKKPAGVTWDKERKKWMAHICINRKAKNLGRYDTYEEARAVRDAAFAEATKGLPL